MDMDIGKVFDLARWVDFLYSSVMFYLIGVMILLVVGCWRYIIKAIWVYAALDYVGRFDRLLFVLVVASYNCSWKIKGYLKSLVRFVSQLIRQLRGFFTVLILNDPIVEAAVLFKLYPFRLTDTD